MKTIKATQFSSKSRKFVRALSNMKNCDINPISHELWNDVITRGGAIMARMDSSHPEAVSRHSRAQN